MLRCPKECPPWRHWAHCGDLPAGCGTQTILVWYCELCIRPNEAQTWEGSQCSSWLPLCESTDATCQGIFFPRKDSLHRVGLSCPSWLPQGKGTNASEAKASTEPLTQHPQQGVQVPPSTSAKRNWGRKSTQIQAAPESQRQILLSRIYDLSSFKWHFDSCVMIPLILI